MVCVADHWVWGWGVAQLLVVSGQLVLSCFLLAAVRVLGVNFKTE